MIAIETLEIPECIRGRLTTDIKTAAEILGISTNAAYRAVGSGDLPIALRLGGRLIVSVPKLLELLGAPGVPRDEQPDAAVHEAA